MDVPIVANVLGTIGAICWSIQLIPQIIINYRRHSTTGLQPSMMLLWAFAGVPLGVYNIVEDFNIALRIQPQILTFLSLVTWAQCRYYSYSWPWQKTVATVVAIGLLMGGVEIGLIFALQRAKGDQMEWPSTLMAILAALLLCAGVLRHYWDIWKMRTVRGISFLFVGIDALGDLTSLVSVFFQAELDILGMVIYGSELILWMGVFACGGYYNFRPWLRRKLELHGINGQPSGHVVRGEDGQVGRELEGVRSTALEELDIDIGRLSSASCSTVFRTASGSGQDEGDSRS